MYRSSPLLGIVLLFSCVAVGGEALGQDCVGQGVRFVRVDALPDGDGCSWATAYNDPQLAFSEANSLNGDSDPENNVVEIWIAKGVYVPRKGCNADPNYCDLPCDPAVCGTLCDFDGTCDLYTACDWPSQNCEPWHRLLGLPVDARVLGGFAGELVCTELGGDCEGKQSDDSCGTAGVCSYPEVASCSDPAGDCAGKPIGEPCGTGVCEDPRVFGCVAGDFIDSLCTEDGDCCSDRASCPAGACSNPTIFSGDLLGDDPANLGDILQCVTRAADPIRPGCEYLDVDGDGRVDGTDINTDDNSYVTTVMNQDGTLDGVSIRGAYNDGVDELSLGAGCGVNRVNRDSHLFLDMRAGLWSDVGHASGCADCR